MVVNIISLNTNGLAESEKRRAVFDFYRGKCDILLLQETHSSTEFENIWTNEWGGKAYFSHGTTNARGVMTLIKKGFSGDISQVKADKEGRVLSMNVFADNASFSLTNVYAPNGDTPQFYIDLINSTNDMSATKKVFMGDFNVILDPNLDSNSKSSVKRRDAQQVEQLMEEYMLCDIWRVRNPTAKRFSWYRSQHNVRNNLKSLQASRLDLPIVSDGLGNQIHDVFYLNGLKSDHSALFLGIDLHPQERGSSYWKFNTSLLQTKDFVSKMNSFLEMKTKQLADLDPQTKWERLKSEIKSMCQDYCRNRTNEAQVKISDLAQQITNQEDMLEELDTSQLEKLLTDKQELDSLINERIRGVMFRSRCNWIEQGEKNSKYFDALESARYTAKVIHSLISEDGQEVVNTADIMKMQAEYYRKLYEKDDTVKFEINGLAPNHVSDEAYELLNSMISAEEVSDAVLDLKNNKCPGPDGIPIDFYKVFWKYLRNNLIQVIEYNYNTKSMHKSASQGVLNLIPKKNKDSRILKNLRPITLLNTDYKIIEKVLVNRIIPELANIIHQDQKGFLPNRRIAHNIRKIFDVISQIDKDDPAIILQIDFQKAFDKCEMCAVTGSLHYFNFLPLIIEWFITLYRNFTVKIQNNGFFSEDIKIERSVHQGAPASAAIFVCIAELLALKIRDDKEIRGVFIKEIENLLNQYADDTDMCLDGQDGRPLRKVFTHLEWFRNNTGCSVNYDKTTVYRIGSLAKSKATFYTENKLCWENDMVNVLGVDVSTDLAKCVNANYERIISSAKATLRSWAKRALSLQGKVGIVNTLIASKFVYAMSVLPAMSDKMREDMQKAIEAFIWNGHKPKISTNVLCASKENGGLELVNLQTKDRCLKGAWVKSVIENDEIMVIANNALKVEGQLIWTANLKCDDIGKVLNHTLDTFWVQVLEAWCLYNYSDHLNYDHTI